MPEFVKLIGILIIVLGFYYKLDVLAVVVIASVVTGFVSGMDLTTILEILGKTFVNTRLMSIFFLSLPVIAILERYGLKERSAELIHKIKNSSAGKVLALYDLLRTLAAAFSLRLGGHVQFIRPLIYPMAEAAAESDKGSELTEDETEELKGLAAAVENYGNFFGQNIFVGASGVILIQATLAESGFQTSLTDIAMWSIPVGVISVVMAVIQARAFDKKIKHEEAK